MEYCSKLVSIHSLKFTANRGKSHSKYSTSIYIFVVNKNLFLHNNQKKKKNIAFLETYFLLDLLLNI